MTPGRAGLLAGEADGPPAVVTSRRASISTFRSEPRAVTSADPVGDDLDREVYCVLGMPVDAVDMAGALARLDAAAARTAPCLVSTPNLNFLAMCGGDVEFRETLLASDLSTADGMPIVWLARLVGAPIRERVAGSDMFEALKLRLGRAPMKVYLFGGPDGVAAAAAQALDTAGGGVRCVGAMSPGFGSIAEMSAPAIIDAINASGADLLAVSLGARKGQAWLAHNHDRLRVPIRAHLGATINFQIGAVRRAPAPLRKLGLEWLWRIKEEPALWRRYARDAAFLARLLVTRVLPLATWGRWQLRRGEHRASCLKVNITQHGEGTIIRLAGSATARHIDAVLPVLREALRAGDRAMTVDLSNTLTIDTRGLGALMMLRKQLRAGERRLRLAGASPTLARLFRLHGAGFLLEGQGMAPCNTRRSA